ncbi:hypothetical protein [Bradyrhizobium sp. 62]|uniref:hypothetical protein n=1 Tax=Bradyrhizobium sp. 62 TaxID=1043588 RepID=UPI001FFA9450|nr:hypothetical protein [Bradyrhizobium sp. 62]
MMSQFELSSRAALCRQLASQDPANQTVWVAEARSWSRLAAEMLPEEHLLKGGITARLFFAFNKLVAAQHEPTPAELMKSRSKRVMPSRSLSPTA